jgi:hypothetical protein
LAPTIPQQPSIPRPPPPADGINITCNDGQVGSAPLVHPPQPHPQVKVVIGTLSYSESTKHQVRREALAGVLARAAAALEVDLPGAIALLHNDAVGPVSAFCKHSVLART